MKALFKMIKRNDRHLESIQEQMHNVNTLPYYSIFGHAQERKKDMETCRRAMKETLNERQLLLENLQLEINKELNRVSQEQKKLTLQ